MMRLKRLIGTWSLAFVMLPIWGALSACGNRTQPHFSHLKEDDDPDEGGKEEQEKEINDKISAELKEIRQINGAKLTPRDFSPLPLA